MNPFSCRAASEHTARKGLHALQGMARWSYRFHLAYCWFCKKYERQLRFMGEAIRRHTRKKLAEAQTDGLKQRILRHLQS